MIIIIRILANQQSIKILFNNAFSQKIGLIWSYFSTTNSTSNYSIQTSFGGLVTIILYGLSFSYFIYILVQWRTGQLLPKITSQSDVLNNYSFFQSDKYIEIGLRRYNTTIYDPFNPDSLILQPMLFVFKNGQVFKSIVPNFETTQLQNGFYTIIISNLSLSISETKSEEFPEYEIMLAFGECNPKWLKNEQKCANQTQTDSFFAQRTNVFVVKQFASEFNTKTQELETFGRETTFPLQSNRTYQIQNYIQLAQTTVDTGFLFETLTGYTYINEFRILSSTLDLEYYGKFFYKLYIVFSYKLDNIQLKYNISYPKISEILADAGSIASSLLFLSFIAIIINENYLYDEAISSVISMYYPEFQTIKVTKTFYGAISKVERNGKIIDTKIFKELYQKWSIISEKKLSFFNQLYEISRLQFLFQQSQSSNIIQQIHQYGIPLPLFLLELDEGLSKQDISLNQDFQLKQNQILPNVSSQSMAVSRNSMLLMQHQSDNKYIAQDSDFDLLVFSEQNQK